MIYDKFNYGVLRTHGLRSHALSHDPCPSSNQSISLQGLVILDVLCELAEWVSCCRALGPAEERHGVSMRLMIM